MFCDDKPSACSIRLNWFNCSLFIRCHCEHWVLPTRGHSLCIPHHNNHYAEFKNLQIASSFNLFIYRLAFSFYTCLIISHKFVLASLRKPYGFFSGFWWEVHSFYFWANLGPKLLYIKTNDPKIDPKGPWSFTNFVIPLHATYIRHSQDKCWNLLLKFECH